MSKTLHQLYTEIDKWKTMALDKKRQLDDLIREKFENRDKIKAKEEQLNASIKELEVIKQNSLKEALLKQKEFEEIIQNEKSKEKTTKGQKMLLLYILGALDSVENLKISKGNKIKLLTYIVGATEKNIEQDFNRRNYPNSKLNIKDNYSWLLDVSKKLEIREFIKPAEDMLDKIYKIKVEK